MKRGFSALFLLLFPAALFAATPTHSYLIGTRRPAREAIVRIARSEGVDAPGRNVEAFDIVDAYRADLTEDEANALRQSSNVAYVEQDAPRHAFGTPLKTTTNEFRSLTGQTIPYGVTMVGAPTLWSVTRGAGINVAVLDTGIDIKHPDLQTAYAGGFNTYFTSTSTTETADPIDDFGHGTHVSGTIAATDNNLGVVGVAPGVKLWAVRVLKSDGKGGASGATSNIVAGIQWVVKEKQLLGGNWIISMSLGGCTASQSEGNAIQAAINAGVIVVAAAGNHLSTKPDTGCTNDATENSYAVAYPGAYPGVIAVAAVDSNSKVADFSNIGPEVAIAAPGVDVLSTVPVGTGSIAYVRTSTGAFLQGAALDGSATGTLTGRFVDCGLGSTASAFPAAVNGNIALIKRGDVTFATKVKNAQAAGATAVVIYNKDDSALAFTLTADTADAGHVWPLTVAVSLADGQNLLAQAPASITVNNLPDDYANEQGTSMATPHVSAVAALVWSTSPGATADAVKQAILNTAHDLGDPGVDNFYGHGLVDAILAAKQLSGLTTINGGKPLTPPSVGRVPGRRGH